MTSFDDTPATDEAAWPPAPSSEADASATAGAAHPATPPIEVLRDRSEDGVDGPELVVIAAGGFWMGSPDDELGRHPSEGPRRRVEIGRPFALGAHPVTFAEYDRFADATGRARPDDQGFGRGDVAVVNISWLDATAHCAWLSERMGVRYRLPSEAEWEYACRAGGETAFWTGPQITLAQANLAGCGCGADPVEAGCGCVPPLGRPSAIGAYPPNPWGLSDMHGNVAEWCADCWSLGYDDAWSDGRPRRWVSERVLEDAATATEPLDQATLDAVGSAVVRGGSWTSQPVFARAADRFYYDRALSFEMVGYRVLREL